MAPTKSLHLAWQLLKPMQKLERLQGASTHREDFAHAHRPGVPATFPNVRRLFVYRIWWSKKHSNINMTITTSLTTDRLQALFAQCDSWAGPTSAVLYVPLVVDKGIRQLASVENSTLISADSSTLTAAQNTTLAARMKEAEDLFNKYVAFLGVVSCSGSSTDLYAI